MPNYNIDRGGVDKAPPITNYMDIGKRMGSDIGTLIGTGVSIYDQEKSKSRIDELMQKYNNPSDPDFANLSPSQRALKMARLLKPYDDAQASKYEQLSIELANKERDQVAKDKAIAEERSFNKNVFETMQRPREQAQKAYDASMTEWESVGATEEELTAELQRAQQDLFELEQQAAFTGEMSQPFGMSPNLGTSPAQNPQSLPFADKAVSMSAPTMGSRSPVGVNPQSPAPFVAGGQQASMSNYRNMTNIMNRYK